MKLLVFCLFFSFSVLAQQEESLRTIVQINQADGLISLYLENGEIVEFDQFNTELKRSALLAYESEAEIAITKISKDAEQPDLISEIKIFSQSNLNKDFTNRWRRNRNYNEDREAISPLQDAYLTKFSSYQEAQNLMDTFNGGTHADSQCYNRANMWTYEAAVNQKAHLGKIWIFFTKKYIREYRYKWWFHIAPYTLVDDANEKYVLDRGFTMFPYNVTNWKNIYMENEAKCPVVENYLDYEKNQKTEYCYLMYSSQFYWQPQHLKRLATKDREQSNYWSRMLRITYRDALGTRRFEIPELGNTALESSRSKRLEKGIDLSFRGAQLGDTVINKEGFSGVITALIENGLVTVKYDDEELEQNIFELAIVSGSTAGYRVGDQVEREDVSGVLAGIYADGSMAIKTLQKEDQLVKVPPKYQSNTEAESEQE